MSQHLTSQIGGLSSAPDPDPVKGSPPADADETDLEQWEGEGGNVGRD